MPFVWDDKYRLGIPEIDRQHQTLLLLLHKALDFYRHEIKALPTAAQRQRALKDLANLREVARAHFATEESLMEQYDYPQLAAHHQEHAEFLKIAGLLEEKISHPGVFSPTEWIDVLLHWYDHHVQHIDREMGEFLREREKT